MKEKGIPPIVIRVLIYAYEEQEAWVKLNGKNSEKFKIGNGTRQGSVISPYLFSSCYLDGLIVELRKLDIGVHIGGIWYGACAYADDLCLMAMNRDMLQKMVKVCENYGLQHNLVFSTDPNPSKSKTKCVLFSGNNCKSHPVPVILDEKPLPWVDRVEHLGHILQSNGSMEADACRARASFNRRADDIRDNLFFAHPKQVVQGIQLYCCDGYGAMLYDLRSEYSEKYFKAWNVQIRNAWRVSEQTHTYLVENYFAAGQSSLRVQTFSKYSKFVQKLLQSPSKEIRFLSKVLKSDTRSTLGKNIWFLNNLTNVNIILTNKYQMRSAIPKNPIPENDQWRVRLLNVLLDARKSKNYEDLNLNKEQLDSMIQSLCIS